MKLEYIPLAGTFLRLQPFAPDLKQEVRSVVDCDPAAWAIMPINPMGDGFDAYWSAACGAPPSQRMAYAIPRCSDNRAIGMSTYYTELLSQDAYRSEPRSSTRRSVAGPPIRRRNC